MNNTNNFNNPILSIVVPVYNTAPYLRECVDSLRSQTLKDIEIICVNDGSTDGSLEILRQYEQIDKRVVIVDQTNQGASVARNNGERLARGKYLLFVDSDDYVDGSFVEKAVSFAEKYQCEVVNLRGKITDFINASLPYVRKLASDLEFDKTQVFRNITEKQRALSLFLMANPGSAIIRRDVWNKYCIKFPDGLRINEDFYVFFELYAVVQNLGFLKSNEFQYYYRSREDSTSHTSLIPDQNGRNKLWDLFGIFKGVKEYYIKNKLLPSSSYRVLVIQFLLKFEMMYFNIPRTQREDFKKELSSCWDDTFDAILDDPQYLPFARRYFWFWLRGKRLHRKIIGFVIILLRKMKRLLA